jgi:rhodanese-related sulfurtransferase
MSPLFGARGEEEDVKRTADALAANPNAVLVDVREPDEWASGHAPGAVHIPMREIPNRLGDLPRDEPLYLICRSGNRSARVAAYLRQEGFARPINVAGGIVAWQRAGLPVEP